MSLYFIKGTSTYFSFQRKDWNNTVMSGEPDSIDFYLYSTAGSALLHKSKSDFTVDQNNVYSLTITSEDIASIANGRYAASVTVAEQSGNDPITIFSDVAIIESTNSRILAVRPEPLLTGGSGGGDSICFGASGSSKGMIPQGYTISDIMMNFDDTTLVATRLSSIIIDVSVLQAGTSVIALNLHDYLSSTGIVRFSGYSIDNNMPAYAELEYDSSDNSLTLTGANMGGNDISAAIPGLSWKINVLYVS